MKKIFIDTNIVVYANDNREKNKQEQAIQVIQNAMRDGNGVISTQVLGEYAQVALVKLAQNQNVVIRQLALLESMEVIQISPVLIRRGVEVRAAYSTSFWDSLIISAAEAGRCDTILSEDFNVGQFYSGIAVRNPFGRV